MENKLKKRIEYIDLVKGICILMVVWIHCTREKGTPLDNLFFCIRMPLYFFLSGMFFKSGISFIDFIIKKINKLIIPFIFFFCFSLLLELIIMEYNSIFYNLDCNISCMKHMCV